MTSVFETNRRREVLKASNDLASWKKKVNLMSPIEVDLAYNELQTRKQAAKNRKINQ